MPGLLQFRALHSRPAGLCGLQRALLQRPVVRFAQSGAKQPVTRCAAAAQPVPLDVRSADGSAGGSQQQLTVQIARPETAKGVVHRYLVTVRQNARQGSASTLTRAEVRGGGRKPFKQKGSGNARQGSRRSPLKRGGGVIFGPKPKDYTIKMNRKEKQLAMATALHSAAGSMVVVPDLKGSVGEPKTKALLSALAQMGVAAEDRVLIVLDELTESVSLAARNVQRVMLNTADQLNVYNVLKADRIVLEAGALALINERYGSGGSDEEQQA